MSTPTAGPDLTYTRLCDHARETALLGSIAGLLEWDERTFMPRAAGAFRAEQLTYLSGLIHERRTDEAVGACPVGALLRKRIGYAVPVGDRLYDHEPIGSDIEARAKTE